MQLTLYTDYSLRVLIYLSKTNKEITTISEISDFYKISKNHLVKVVHQLAQHGFIISLQGKGGGIKLAKDPRDVIVGDVIRKTEPNFHMVECFNEKTNHCVITDVCRLKGILNHGMLAFFNVMDQYTLADCSTNHLSKRIKSC
jgi:Rrf2 family transcriptional regulator, nitric oxide-sensitive transcriptional repressor